MDVNLCRKHIKKMHRYARYAGCIIDTVAPAVLAVLAVWGLYLPGKARRAPGGRYKTEHFPSLLFLFLLSPIFHPSLVPRLFSFKSCIRYYRATLLDSLSSPFSFVIIQSTTPDVDRPACPKVLHFQA